MFKQGIDEDWEWAEAFENGESLTGDRTLIKKFPKEKYQREGQCLRNWTFIKKKTVNVQEKPFILA